MVLNFYSLPEGIQLDICGRLASSCDVQEIHRFRSLSRTNIRLCDDPHVLRVSSIRLPDYLWYSDPTRRYPDFHQIIHNYKRRCAIAGNTTAKYDVGLSQFFEEGNNEERRYEGLRFLAEAAGEGMEEATKIYGLLLVCFGGASREQGYRILSPFSIPLIPDKVIEMELYWANRRAHLAWRGRPMMSHLKRSYIRQNCACDGLTSEYFAKVWGGWERFARFEGMGTSMACDVCLWHEVLQIMFDFNDGNYAM